MDHLPAVLEGIMLGHFFGSDFHLQTPAILVATKATRLFGRSNREEERKNKRDNLHLDFKLIFSMDILCETPGEVCFGLY